MQKTLKKLLRAALPATLWEKIRTYRTLPVHVARLERKLAMLARHQARTVHGCAEAYQGGRSVINCHELQVYSQHGEDGILQFLFSEIGTAGKLFVEFGMGDGRECNTAYLTLEHGWRGLLMDGSPERAAAARAFYTRTLGDGQEAVAIVEAWITAENINQLIEDAGLRGEVDLLSIDLDGIDYWVWSAIEVIRPRVIIVEYSAVLGSERRITVPYDPRFVRWQRHPSGLYAGASLAALASLGKEKGYKLVGCESCGINAFFVRDDIATDSLSALTPETAYFPGDDLVLGLITPDRFAHVAHLNWEEV